MKFSINTMIKINGQGFGNILLLDGEDTEEDMKKLDDWLNNTGNFIVETMNDLEDKANAPILTIVQ
jgi:hypothetical protein